eukprot:1187523-Rhodomonas_salina.1
MRQPRARATHHREFRCQQSPARSTLTANPQTVHRNLGRHHARALELASEHERWKREEQSSTEM